MTEPLPPADEPRVPPPPKNPWKIITIILLVAILAGVVAGVVWWQTREKGAEKNPVAATSQPVRPPLPTSVQDGQACTLQLVGQIVDGFICQYAGTNSPNEYTWQMTARKRSTPATPAAPRTPAQSLGDVQQQFHAAINQNRNTASAMPYATETCQQAMNTWGLDTDLLDTKWVHWHSDNGKGTVNTVSRDLESYYTEHWYLVGGKWLIDCTNTDLLDMTEHPMRINTQSAVQGVCYDEGRIVSTSEARFQCSGGRWVTVS